jgi:hypothetical protein
MQLISLTRVASVALVAILIACDGDSGEGSPSDPLIITTSALPLGGTDESYLAPLTATRIGSAVAATWSVTKGELPWGLAIVGATLQGTPPFPETQIITLTASDGAQEDSREFVISVASSALIITTPSEAALPAGRVGLWYAFAFTARGGTKPYSWTIQSGTLPAGSSHGQRRASWHSKLYGGLNSAHSALARRRER